VFEVDRDFRLTFANRHSLLVFGYPEEDLQRRRDPLEMLVPEDRSRAAERMSRLCAGEDLPPGEYTALRRDGSTFPVLIFSSLLVEDGTPVGLRGIIVDISDLRRAEEALRRQEEKERLILDHVDEIVYAIGMDGEDPLRGTVEFVSARVEEITGFPPRQFVEDASLWFRLVHPDDVRTLKESTARILASRKPGIREYRLRHRNDSHIWIEDHIVPQLDQAGRPRGYLGVARDVTERRRVVQALEARTRQQAAVAELGQLALERADTDTLLQEAAARLAGTLDVELAEVFAYRPERDDFTLHAGLGWKDGCVGSTTVPGGDGWQPGHVIGLDDPVIVEDFGSETRFRIPDLLREHGARSGMSVAVRIQGRPWGTLGVHSVRQRAFGADDVNFLRAVAHLVAAALERIRAEEAIAHRIDIESLLGFISTRFVDLPSDEIDPEIGRSLRLVGEFAAVDRSYLFQLSADGTRLHNTHEWCSDPALAQIDELRDIPAEPFAWTLRHLRAQQVVHIPRVRDLPPEAQAEHEEFERQGIQSLILVPMVPERRLLGFVGFDAVRMGKSWSAEDTRILQMLAEIFAGALERRRVEEERRALEERLRVSQKMEAIGRLAGGVAHDLNNILTAISGYCDLLLRGDRPERTGRNVAGIRHAAERAASLTQQLLAVSRRQVLVPRILDLRALVDGLQDMLRRLIGEDIEFAVSSPEALGRVRADQGQVEQVILNLIVNARDAMPTGGRLELHLEDVEVDANGVEGHRALRAGRYVRLSVRDSGIGMDEETRPRIFEPFFTTKEKGRGTGLGLSTVYGVVEQSGGTVTVESELGRGATFNVYLPHAAPHETESKVPRESRERPSGGETVLLVEDDETVRAVTRELLELHGYRVLEAADAQAALARSQGHDGPIELLLSDVVMPGASGVDLADRLRQDRQEMRVLLISGYTDEALVPHGAVPSEVPFLQKPFSTDELALRLREVLDSDSPPGASP
jgi:PAS domain S-box-containing protein